MDELSLEKTLTSANIPEGCLKEMVILLRGDLDSSVNKKKTYKSKAGEEPFVVDNDRLKATALFAQDLITNKGAKAVLIIGHQKRKGELGFTTLEQHANYIEKYVLGLKTEYIGETTPAKIQERIKIEGVQVLVGPNTRMLDGEQKGAMPLYYADLKAHKIIDAVAQNAVAVIHRNDKSISALDELFPVFLGADVTADLENLARGVDAAKQGPALYLLNGMKIDDLGPLIKAICDNASNTGDVICAGGGLGLLALDIKNYKVGVSLDEVKKKLGDNYDTFRAIIEKVVDSPRFLIPQDILFDHNGVLTPVDVEKIREKHAYEQSKAVDIGPGTAYHYADQIKGKKAVFLKGSTGITEDPRIRRASRIILGDLIEYARAGGTAMVFGGEGGATVLWCGFDPNCLTHIFKGGNSSVYCYGRERFGIEEYDKLPGIESAMRSFRNMLDERYEQKIFTELATNKSKVRD